MAVTEKEVLDYIGIDPSKHEDIEAFKTAYDGEWLKRSEAFKDDGLKKQVFGKQAGVITTKVKQLLKEFGEDVSEADLSKIDITELPSRLDAAAKKHFGAVVKDLETKLEGAKGDKSTKELEKQLAEAIKHRDDYKKLSDDLDTKLKAKDQEFITTTRTQKENELWHAAMAKAPFRKDLDAFTRKGFEAEMRAKAKILFDEEGKPYTANAIGERIKDTTKSNAFLELEQVIAAEVIANKLNEANPHAGKPVGATSKPSATSTQLEDKIPPRPMRQLHPNAVPAQ
jgi:hypothetical protein